MKFDPNDPSLTIAIPPGGIDLDEAPDGAPQDKSETDTDLLDRSIMNPLTGALVDPDDLDSLIQAAIDAKSQLNDLHSFEDAIRRRIGEFTTGTAKTRRVRGKTLQAKVEMPDDNWDQSVLKEAWNSYPNLRDELLRLGSVNVKLTEFKKLANMSTDDPAFAQFAKMILAAQRPATGAPRISIEG